MKKALVLFFLLLILTISYLVYDDLSFDPLNKMDFSQMFKTYNGKTELICKKDFLGITTRGGAFELYVYSLGNAVVTNDYPKFIDFENIDLPKAVIGKWRNCPIDKETMDSFRSTIASTNISSTNCSSTFNKEIVDKNNLFSYITVNETDIYFLLFCPKQSKLYYIRRKGF